ncbi:class I SAM-dependent methyltransferase [uncultured Desulfosarcina sp.]|uniref:class I SAM-dependent methyltransferase n=1 Tax=uncultured Desulfosarcina sp. TaxID=218289 RepID=UPI0029C6690E|nr:class I SAM-dependent methyltransferase [uncultured Desulfosarcina sp.]
MNDQKEKAYQAKATFFDAQVQAEWAAKAYGAGEMEKLERIFEITGPLAGLRLLEPGCGTGRLTEVLAQRVGPLGRVVAMDISPQMVAAAHRRLDGCDNVELYQGSIEALADRLGTFDHVICHQVFPHFADHKAAFGMLARMLEPGGLLVISHFISIAEINDVHRNAGTAVAADLMPPAETMRRWCAEHRLCIDTWQDDDDGYLLCAKPNG